MKIFRVVPDFVVQFGISPYPQVSKAWANATIPDDVVTNHNTRGAVSFASAGPNTRTTQIFVNLGDNRSLDNNGFAPVGSVTSGMKVLDELYSGLRRPDDGPPARDAEPGQRVPREALPEARRDQDRGGSNEESGPSVARFTAARHG